MRDYQFQLKFAIALEANGAKLVETSVKVVEFSWANKIPSVSMFMCWFVVGGSSRIQIFRRGVNLAADLHKSNRFNSTCQIGGPATGPVLD